MNTGYTKDILPFLSWLQSICSAKWVQSPTHWKEARSERKKMRPLPGITASKFLLSNLGSVLFLPKGCLVQFMKRRMIQTLSPLIELFVL